MLARHTGVALQNLRIAEDAVERCAQLVGQAGDVATLGGVGRFAGLLGFLQGLVGFVRDDSSKMILYFINAFLLFGCILIGRFILASKLGRLLMAMRDKEERVRFSGYDVASFKIFVFCVAAAFSAIGGAMFALQVGFMSPSFVGIVPSIEMVIFAAVGGRMSLLGAVYGALLVNYGKTYFSETFPELWLYLMGGLFIAVVMYFPNGLAGLWESHGRKWLGKLSRKPAPLKAPAATAETPASTSQPRELETTP